MIYTYPLLVSNSVSPNTLPGICKVLERFILIYDIDNVIKKINGFITFGNIVKIGAGLVLAYEGGSKILNKAKPEIEKMKKAGVKMPSFFRLNLNEENNDPQQDKEERDKEKHKWDKERNEKSLEKSSFEASVEESRKRKVSIDTPNFNSVSVEPTWIRVDSSMGTKVIGIKVVPFPVKDEQNFLDLFMSERLKAQSATTLDVITRKITKFFWKYWNMPMPLISNFSSDPKSISGDPEKDVIYGKTAHGEKIFTAFNMTDIEPEFLSNASNIAKLHKIGWTSFIVCDDIAKRAFFCMDKFNGLCSSIPYANLYATLSKEQLSVFKDLEDVRKTSSPFFRLSTRSSKIFGESVAKNTKLYFEDI